MFGGVGLRVIHRPRWWNAATFCLSWTAVLACCLLAWAAAISLLP